MPNFILNGTTVAILIISAASCGPTSQNPIEEVDASDEARDAARESVDTLTEGVEIDQSGSGTPVVVDPSLTPTDTTEDLDTDTETETETETLNILTNEEATVYLNERLLGDYAQVLDSIDQLDQIDFSAAPSGDLNYAGYMQVLVSNGNATGNALGEFTMTVDLGTLDVSGEANNFIGSANTGNGQSSAFVRYDGTITASNGTAVPEVTNEDLIRFDVDGTLENGVNTFGVTGNVTAGIFGDDAEGIIAFGNNSSTFPNVGQIATTVDGTSVEIPGNFVLINALRN